MIVESALIIGGLSWVLDTVVEHSVGATGHELIREFVRGAMRELRDPDKRESNHTIARAVRGAQIDALEMVLDGFAIGNAPNWDQAPDTVVQKFLREAAEFCRRGRNLLKDNGAELDFMASATLAASVEGLFADQTALTTAGARAVALGSFAENVVLDELAAALTPVSIPNDFGDYLRAGAGKDHPRFLDLFGASIAERLKDKQNTGFRDILQTRWLADLKALGIRNK